MNTTEITAVTETAMLECAAAMAAYDSAAFRAANTAGDHEECKRLMSRRNAAQDALNAAISLVPDARRARIDRNIRAINAAQAASWHDDHRV